MYPFNEVWDTEHTALRAACEAARDKCERVARVRAASVGIDVDDYVDALRELFNVDVDALADALAARGITIAALRALVDVVDVPAPYEYRDADWALFTIQDAPADHAVNRKRADGTVRGARRGYVVASNHPPMPYADALAAANALLGDDPTMRLIGTDEYNWSQIVHYRPAAIVIGGMVYAVRPESQGVPIVNDPYNPDNRKRAPQRPSRPRYYVRPAESVDVDGWPMNPHYRIVKRYRMTHNGRTMIGHRRVDTVRVARKAARKSQGPRVDVATLTDAMTHAVPVLRAAFTGKRSASVRYRCVDGATATIGADSARNRYRLRVRRADGASVTSTYRTIDAMAAAIARLA